MSRLLIALFFMAGAGLAAAQVQPAARELPVGARQQAALGIRTVAVQPATTGLLLASATVGVPPGQDVTVTAPYEGVITRIDVGLGDTVRKGAALLSLSSPTLADARRQAREAQLEALNAQTAFQRDQAMYDEGLIPAARLQLSQNRYRAADSASQAHQAMLRATGQTGDSGGDYASGTVRAPRQGSVIEALAGVGQRVEAGAILFRIADLRQLQLDIVLSGDKAGLVRTGDNVTVPTREASATVIGVSRALDASHQARVRARVTAPGRLQIAEVLPVQIHPRREQNAAPAWRVPSRAVVLYRGQSWVLLASPGGFVPTRVQVLSGNDESAIVEGALGADRQVAHTGIASLRALMEQGE
jgi:RND family efflux transporter MFP subunit